MATSVESSDIGISVCMASIENACLSSAGRAGRKPLLDVKQRARLTALLLEGPEKLGYETPLWTCPRVADLIERESVFTIMAGMSGNHRQGNLRIPNSAVFDWKFLPLNESGTDPEVLIVFLG
jgi:hypothetical protein